jgi:hypothetical protein
VSPAGSPTVRRRRLAAELRRLRGRRTGSEVSRAIGWSPTKISRAESGRESIPPEEVAKLVEFYEVAEPLRGHLLALAEDAVQRGWWEDYTDVLTPEYSEFIGLEAEATSISTCQFDVIPGLLQTEDYARHISLGYQRVIPTPPSVIEQLVHVRMTRQERLTQEPVLQLRAIIDEAVLLRNMGGPAVMRPQLEHLLAVGELPNVDVRVLPLSRDTSLASGSFTIFGFGSATRAEAGLGDVVSTENLKAELYVEGEASDIYMYRVVHKSLMDASLSPGDSREFIIQMAAAQHQGR